MEEKSNASDSLGAEGVGAAPGVAAGAGVGGAEGAGEGDAEGVGDGAGDATGDEGAAGVDAPVGEGGVADPLSPSAPKSNLDRKSYLFIVVVLGSCAWL